jgi:hypothetical protein
VGFSSISEAKVGSAIGEWDYLTQVSLGDSLRLLTAYLDVSAA